MIDELYQLFLKLSDTVDEDFHHPELTLKPCGYGDFQLMEARVWEPDANWPYPNWAIKQRLQAKWFTIEEGITTLRELARKGNLL